MMHVHTSLEQIPEDGVHKLLESRFEISLVYAPTLRVGVVLVKIVPFVLVMLLEFLDISLTSALTNGRVKIPFAFATNSTRFQWQAHALLREPLEPQRIAAVSFETLYLFW